MSVAVELSGTQDSTDCTDRPKLPAHASPRAHAAVQLAFDRQQAIRERIEQIHALPGGPGKGQAVSELMRHFGQLYRLTNEALDGDAA